MATKKKKTAKTRARAAVPAAKRPARRAQARRGRAQEGLTLRSVGPSFTVNDLEKSLAWYRDVLGLTVGERWEHEGKLMGVEMQAGRATFMLTQDDWKKGRDRVKGEGFRLYCATAQDVDRLAERIKAHGGTLAQEPRDESWGARALTVEDPDGFKMTIARER
jgi:uncharacterized glyoxalase superfamily protein PhnB